MIMDSRAEFAAASTALNTGVAGSYLLGNVIDLSVVTANFDVGLGEQLYLIILVNTAVTSAGAATVQFQLVSDTVAAISPTAPAHVHAATGAIPKATLVAGYRAFVVALPLDSYSRYLGIVQVTGVAALTAGAVQAFIVLRPAKWLATYAGVH